MSAVALPSHYKFVALNSTGQVIASSSIVIKGKRAKIAADGTLTYDIETTVFTYGSSLGVGAYAAGSAIDNTATADKWLSCDFVATVTAHASANGIVQIYLHRSTDGGTTFDTNGNGEPLVSILCVGAGPHSASFEL
jgi:hypothetical protein